VSGERSEVAYWRDAEGRPCEPDEAVSVEIVELDAAGGELRRTYARLDTEPQDVTLGPDGLPEEGRPAGEVVAGIEARKAAGLWPPPLGAPRTPGSPGGSPKGSQDRGRRGSTSL
jgi:hypothetical protein